MDLGGNASGVHEEGSSSNRSNKISNRHTPKQVQYLERFFTECPHPDKKQQMQISKELGLEPCQIKFWFQNKRTLLKTKGEQADSSSLRSENERMKSENLAMREALMNASCTTCGSPLCSKDESQHNIGKLLSENANLKKKYEIFAAKISALTGKPISEIDSWVASGPPVDFTAEDVSRWGIRGSALNVGYSSNNPTFATSQSEPISDAEKSVMVETAVGAMDELLKVIQMRKPLWTNSNGRYTLNNDCYEKVFMRSHSYEHNFNTKLEASMDSCDVALNAILLVNMILDSRSWLDLFPTLLTNTEILNVVETGMPVNRNGSLHLMHEVMHSLTPLVAARETRCLRFCRQVHTDTWVIADVSYSYLRDNDGNIVPHCRKRPSGCMIQTMPDGHSKVTWVEIVEVDPRAFTHRLYRDLVTSGIVFGAERWIATLKQMCERAFLSNDLPNDTHAGWTVEGKRSVMDLSHRMMREFCAALNMPINEPDFPHLSEIDNSGIQVSTRKCADPFKPEGMAVCVSTSLWLPLSPQQLFAFFQDDKLRSQWDYLSHGNSVKEIARAHSGHHPGNNVSLFQVTSLNFLTKLVESDESHNVILQETFVDLLGYYLVFAPLEPTAINVAVSGLKSSNIPLLPSGFVITTDGHNISPKVPYNKPGDGPYILKNKCIDENAGSLLTVAFQILLSDSAHTDQKHMEAVRDASALLSSTVNKIKAALLPTSSSKTPFR